MYGAARGAGRGRARGLALAVVHLDAQHRVRAREPPAHNEDYFITRQSDEKRYYNSKRQKILLSCIGLA